MNAWNLDNLETLISLRIHIEIEQNNHQKKRNLHIFQKM
jgi:hypothetical protein